MALQVPAVDPGSGTTSHAWLMGQRAAQLRRQPAGTLDARMVVGSGESGLRELSDLGTQCPQIWVKTVLVFEVFCWS